jgi:hypothetical protein
MKKIVKNILPAILLVFAGLQSAGCSKAEEPDPPEASEEEAEGETPDGPQGQEPEVDSEE